MKRMDGWMDVYDRFLFYMNAMRCNEYGNGNEIFSFD